MSTYKIDNKEAEIRKVYRPTDKEFDTLQHTYKRYHQMWDKRQEEEVKWDKWEKQWNAYRPPKDEDDWKSNIYIPLTTAIVEAQLSEVIEQSLRPWVVARGSEDEPKAKVINAIIDYTWENAKSDIALQDMIKDALIFGTGIAQEYYLRQPRTIRDEKGNEQQIVEYDDCYLEPVRLWDFFVDERGRGFSGPNQAQDCIRRYVMDYDDFRSYFKGKIWDPMGNAALVKPGGDTNYYEFYQPPERMDHSHEVEVLWYWNKPSDLLCIVANDVVVVMKPNPYKHKQLPFVRAIDIKRPYQFYGKGEPELLESLQEENNILRRMIIDRNHLDIDKPIFVSDTLTIEDEDTIARPHGIIPVGDINQMKFAEYSDIPQSVFRSLELLNDDKIRVTGMDERLQGLATGGTATEVAILKEATLKRINMKMWQMKNDTLIDIGRLRVANIMQFYTQPKMEEIVGENAVAKAEREGTLVQSGRQKFRKTYRQIRLKDQALGIGHTGQPELTPTKGYTFFEARPEYFLPRYGGYDIRFLTTPTIPLSKPLQQQKADELYDRLARNETVDQWALAEFLINSREQDPDKFKKKAPEQGQGQPIDLQKAVDLAGMENSEMMQGKLITSTPYAPMVHTEIHVEFMNSERFKKEAPDNVLKIFTQHVMGEMAALQQRGGGAQVGAGGGMGEGMVGAGATMASSGGEMNASMADVNPGQMQGGGETQNVSGAQSQ